MADNYLEKHYDDYLKRKAAWEKSRKHSIKNKPHPLWRDLTMRLCNYYFPNTTAYERDDIKGDTDVLNGDTQGGSPVLR